VHPFLRAAIVPVGRVFANRFRVGPSINAAL
jgi:hypothetical protein